MNKTAKRLKRCLRRESHPDWAQLDRRCRMELDDYKRTYAKHNIVEFCQDRYYIHIRRGAKVLAVAHLDSHGVRGDVTRVPLSNGDEVVYTERVDDRLGVYTVLDRLPDLGIAVDVLLTTGEETCVSTAENYANKVKEKHKYNWIVEFDRMGTDIVTYDYGGDGFDALLKSRGAKNVNCGMYSDIVDMEAMGVKAFNVGVGMQDYHSPYAHFFLGSYLSQIAWFRSFYDAMSKTKLPHTARPTIKWWNDDAHAGWGQPRWRPAQTTKAGGVKHYDYTKVRSDWEDDRSFDKPNKGEFWCDVCNGLTYLDKQGHCDRCGASVRRAAVTQRADGREEVELDGQFDGLPF